MHIQQLIKDNDIKQVFRAFKSAQYDQELCKYLLEEASVLRQYYYIKAFKVVDIDRFLDFAKNVRDVTPTYNELLRNVLSLYGQHEDDLQHCHKPEDGLPKLADYISIAKEVLCTQQP
jgi:hypothetical protein